MLSELKKLLLESEKKDDYKTLDKPVTCSNLHNGKYAKQICIYG